MPSNFRTSGSARKGSTGSFSSGRTSGKANGSYKNCCNTFNNKIQGFKTLMTQTTGSGSCPKPTPATLNSFANWINKGAIIQTVSCAQVSKWAKAKNKTFNTKSATPASCKTVLCSKFGKTAIKAVTRMKTGSFMVATSPTCKGKKFSFPK